MIKIPSIFLKLKSVFIISILSLFLSSCNITKLLKDNESLLKKNIIISNSEDDVLNKYFIKEELQTIPIQKPNKKFLYFMPIKLMIYAGAAGKKETKIKWWLKNKVGEPPVIFDSTKVEKSKNLLVTYYQNKGYFFTEVKASYKTNKRKRTTVTYDITPNEAFRIRNTYYTNKSVLDKIVFDASGNSLFKKGANFDVVTLKNERQRIADVINDHGYYQFTKDYVFFELDTFHLSKEVDLKIRLANYKDSLEFDLYRFDSVLVYFDNDIEVGRNMRARDSLSSQEYKFYFNKLMFRPNVIKNAIFLNKDSLYNKSLYQSSVQKLSELGTFRFVNISFADKVEKDSIYKLNTFVTLTPYKRQYLSYGLELYNNFEGLFGSGISVSYNNRNLTKNADKLSITATLGTEFNFKTTTTNTNTNRLDFLLSSEYYINRLLFPINYKVFNKNYRSITKIGVSYNFENRSDFYKLHNTNFTFGYQFTKQNRIKHAYFPVSINLIYLPENSISDSFKVRLQNNPILKNSFSETLILGSNYTFGYTSDLTKETKHQYSLTFSAETAGNFFELGALIGGKSNKNKNIFGRNYSQYLKLLTELRYQYKIGHKTSLNSKFKMGYGVAYGNSLYLPYIKQFFGGGPNSIRGWTVRTLGPGGYIYPSSSKIVDELGDIQLEMSAEYRFNIFKWFNGAIFMDAGNIWLRQPDALKPNAEFDLSRLFQDIAIAGGIGLRMDFDYFVIRWDVGFPLKLPYQTESGQWVIDDIALGSYTWRQQNLVHNLAVGFPF